MYDVTIIGGGIIGLSVGMAIVRRAPQTKLLILEKEGRWGHHQTGHNSGEIHSGIYYTPGSLKATLCREGNRTMIAFCREHGIPHEICGKVVVAVDPAELPALDRLQGRAAANGILANRLSREELRHLEPYCAGVAGLQVPSTGIVDYRLVAEMFAEIIRKQDGEVRLETEVKGITVMPSGLRIDSPTASFETRYLVNCAGLHSDRIAALMGLRTGMRIVPIRGEYYRVAPEKQHLVKTLIYPLPNPRYPFLGVHFNRQLDGTIRVGPSAVLSLKREGYERFAFGLRDARDCVSSPGFWRFVAGHWLEGSKELLRSFSKTLFVRRAQQLLPDIRSEDLIPASTGVRAQAVMDDGRVMDDFVILRGPRSIHVCNAPSPAATASIPIGQYVVDRLHEQGML